MLKTTDEVKTPLKKHKTMSDQLTYWLFVSPFLILFFLFTVLPVIASLVLSFFDYDMVSSPIFIGLGNYMRMFTTDTEFATVAKNTLVLAILTGPAGFLLSFVLAWFINELSPTLRAVLAFLFYAPSLGGNVYMIWQVLFSSDSYGYANSMLLSLGLITEPILWFKNTAYNVALIVIIQLWMSMGVSFLANIAGLQDVNPELYEAGALDGIRSRWHELWYITLPGMKNMLLFSAVMQIAGAFSIGGICTTLCGYPSVNNSVDTLVTHLLDVGNVRYEMGYAAAISVFLFIVMALFREVVNRLLSATGK